ncbi:MAG: cytidylate kinase-like family protein [Candidatus Handelsmanbacteria bacterium]|nr:cytidylate kinase-like family protein [Candidatus Handelsmanbacteria bacterium]
MAVITIARQLGSSGDWIAEKVAEQLGYQCVDRRLVEEMAGLADVPVEEVEKLDEKGEGRIALFLKRLLVPEAGAGGLPLAVGFPEFGMEFPYLLERGRPERNTYMDRGTYQLLITTLVQDFGATGKTVVVGRASQLILAELPGAFHCRVVAPFKLRCERLAQARQMDLESAARLVEQHDRWRKQYLENYYSADWDDPLLYHLTINTGKVEPEAAVELIAGCAEG